MAVNSEPFQYFRRGIEAEFFAEIDDRTSDQCKMLQGTIFKADSTASRQYRPPLNHNCRSDILPVIDSDPDRQFENRDFHKQLSQDGKSAIGQFDDQGMNPTFENINTYNSQYRIYSFVLDKDIERRIADEKGLQ